MSMILDGSNGVTFNDSSLQGAAASPYVVKNRLINGSMAVDQRNNGSSVSIASGAGNIYTVDRWAGATSGGTATYQRVAGPTGYQYAMQITGGSGVTQAQLFQRIESSNSYDLASKTVTVSFVTSSTTVTSLNVLVVYPTSGQDNWSGGYTNIATNTITINSTDTAYSTSFSLPSNVTNGMGLIFYTGSFTSGTLKITGVQLEIGTSATPFERRLYNQELANCQRYYEILGNGVTGTWYATTTCQLGMRFSVSKRASPTMALTTTSPQVADPGIANLTGSSSTIVVGGSTIYGFYGNITGFTGATQYHTAIMINDYLTASAEL
jgi:hypothetical protein